jgi:hypothetical protein|tara:strand:- start:34 stop:171 length:138 start_codon:yes stop_codon:yes gene_type:complete
MNEIHESIEEKLSLVLKNQEKHRRLLVAIFVFAALTALFSLPTFA